MERAKNVYRKALGVLEKIPGKLDTLKVILSEDIAIHRKTPIYSKVVWTTAQQKEFDDYWISVYGKKISNKWHRLYQAMSGNFAVDYIPEKLYTTKIEPQFNDRKYAVVFQDKSLIELFAHDSGCLVPDTICVCSNGQYYNQKREPISLSMAEKLIAESQDDFVIKPSVGSSSGKGVTFWHAGDKKALVEMKRMGMDYIVQKAIKQHEAFAVFNPSSINTIRITTYLAGDSIQYMPIAFRIGRSGKKVDNIHAGGIGVGVKEDGSLLPLAYELGYGDCTKKYSEHPDSKVKFGGYILPGISKIIESACILHGRMPHIGVVSWDFSVDEVGNAILIEANILGQGVWFPQFIHGIGLFGNYTKDVLSRLKR